MLIALSLSALKGAVTLSVLEQPSDVSTTVLLIGAIGADGDIFLDLDAIFSACCVFVESLDPSDSSDINELESDSTTLLQCVRLFWDISSSLDDSVSDP